MYIEKIMNIMLALKYCFQSIESVQRKMKRDGVLREMILKENGIPSWTNWKKPTVSGAV